jgi:hypothetical protein
MLQCRRECPNGFGVPAESATPGVVPLQRVELVEFPSQPGSSMPAGRPPHGSISSRVGTLVAILLFLANRAMLFRASAARFKLLHCHRPPNSPLTSVRCRFSAQSFAAGLGVLQVCPVQNLSRKRSFNRTFRFLASLSSRYTPRLVNTSCALLG